MKKDDDFCESACLAADRSRVSPLRRLPQGKNAELYAICDLADDLREQMAAIHRRAWCTATTTRCSPTPVEAVIVAIADSFTSPPVSRRSTRASTVLVEKPRTK